MMQSITGAGLIFFTSFAAFAQPAFDVASVKPAPPPTDHNLRVQMGGDAGRVNYSNVTLMNVLAKAYGVKEHQITGPDWLKTERYDIVATVPSGTRSCSAASFRLFPSRSQRTRTARCLSGKRLISLSSKGRRSAQTSSGVSLRGMTFASFARRLAANRFASNAVR